MRRATGAAVLILAQWLVWPAFAEPVAPSNAPPPPTRATPAPIAPVPPKPEAKPPANEAATAEPPAAVPAPSPAAQSPSPPQSEEAPDAETAAPANSEPDAAPASSAAAAPSETQPPAGCKKSGRDPGARKGTCSISRHTQAAGARPRARQEIVRRRQDRRPSRCPRHRHLREGLPRRCQAPARRWPSLASHAPVAQPHLGAPRAHCAPGEILRRG